VAQRALVAIAAATVSLAAPATARSQSPEELQAARGRFDEGLSLAAAGDWAGALAAFQEVGRIKLTPQVRFHIARCEEMLGWWVRALGKYRLAVVEARGVDGAAEAGQRAAAAVARLEREVPVLEVTVRGADGRVELFLDGAPLGPASGVRAVLVDPGDHRVDARHGATSVTQTVRAAASQRHRVELAFSTASGAPAPAPAPLAPRRAPDLPPPAVETGDGAKLAPWLLVGVGGAALVTGAVALAVRQDAVGDHDACEAGRCPPALEDAGARGRTANAVMWSGFAVGGAALTAGVVWLVMRDPPPPAQAGAAPFDGRRLRFTF
jgi:hypothetical protein